jgi:hypothetical protein
VRIIIICAILYAIAWDLCVTPEKDDNEPPLRRVWMVDGVWHMDYENLDIDGNPR